ncbi:conserved hypothetical protein [Leishmania major strain Friedlin]|uniref:DUF7920 domain-containing protein n=1 Tax=Leishmania major TaxID=5664 RepID=Q4QBE3_LEIMA|nr:conserved hypothetical protein [Leishmania major strain Friedlin]CAG9574132.1 hypothetical_protein_-_conserved [Leishmania major strain Friedlin]CAJ04023.1 conserved hypothetical protein [Leishmania major strain Friedlin]|eukprot:XP_001683355.1 conserved hypothetical protein [Leishmania major strain Friedlin]
MPFHIGAVVVASHGSVGSSPADGSFSDLTAADIYGSLQPPPALSLPARSETSPSHRTKDNPAAGVIATAAAASSSPPSQTAAQAKLSITAAGGSNEHSTCKSLVSVLDDEQRRCVNAAYHISFHGNTRVKLKPTAVVLPNGAHFLIVDRFVSGNCDGVYEKNKKMWEHIPIGQARVFARAHAAAPTISLAELVGSAQVNCEGSGPGTATTVAVKCPRRSGSPTSIAASSPPRSPPIAPLPTARAVGSSSQPNRWEYSSPQQHSFHSEWTRVATAVGLRKMGHWREATSVFSIHKEVSKRATALEKVDGEPGRIAAFSWMGERYWIIGCRYQHIVTRLDVPEADLMRYVASSSSSTSTSSSSSSVSDDATVSVKVSSAKQPSLSSRVNSPTQNPQDYVERGSAHSYTVAGGAAALAGAGSSSDAAYLDLAVRMARLWRRVLESLRITAEDAANALDTASASDAAVAAAHADALIELHTCVAADNRSLCFDAIMSGWERLQSFFVTRDVAGDESMSTASTPVSCTSIRTYRTSSTAFMMASTPVTDGSGATRSTVATVPVATPLWFYAITWDASLDERGWCMGVEEAFAFFGRFRLPTVTKSAEVQVGSPEYEALRQLVLSRFDTAGAVMYGSNRDEADGAKAAVVVQVWKCRSYPHSLERVVQEYVVTHRLCGEPLRCKVKKKVSSLSRETRLCIKQWELHRLPFLLDFALWLHREKYITPSTDLVALKAIRGHWLSYQERFQKLLEAQLRLRHRGSSCQGTTASTPEAVRRSRGARADTADGVRCSARSDDEDAGVPNGNRDLQQHKQQDEAPSQDTESLDPIMLVGPQGCGKSTMARILYALLEEAGAAPRWLNQDEVGNRSAYLAAIRRAVTQGSYSHLLLDKMNLDDKSRSDYAAAGLKPVLVVVWTHSAGVEAMVEACYERVVKRGVRHRTFCTEDVTLLHSLPSSISSRSPELGPAVVPLQQSGVTFLSGSADTTAAPSSSASVSMTSVGHYGCSPNVPFLTEGQSPPPSSRLHSILQASAKRYQVPANVPLVDLDMTWSCETMVAAVWEALRDRGTCVLPPLAELNVMAAMQTAYAYEQLLETYPSRVVSAVLRGPASGVVLRQLSLVHTPLIIPKTQRLQPHVEILLHNFCLHPSPTALVRYAGQVGCTRRMTVQAVVSNSKVALLLVLGPTETAAADSAACTEMFVDGEAAVVPLHAGATQPALYAAPLLNNASGEAAAMGKGATGVSAASAADDPNCIEARPMQEHFAVLAKAKVTPDYCEELAQRVRDDPDADPYCAVQWLSPPLEMDFAVTLLLP